MIDILTAKRAALQSSLEQIIGQANRVNGAIAVIDELLQEASLDPCPVSGKPCDCDVRCGSRCYPETTPKEETVLPNQPETFDAMTFRSQPEMPPVTQEEPQRCPILGGFCDCIVPCNEPVPE